MATLHLVLWDGWGEGGGGCNRRLPDNRGGLTIEVSNTAFVYYSTSKNLCIKDIPEWVVLIREVPILMYTCTGRIQEGAGPNPVGRLNILLYSDQGVN